MGAGSSRARREKGTLPGLVPFQAIIDLLWLFLTHREEIVASIEALLDAGQKPLRYLQDQALLSRLFEECFLTRTAASASQKRLRRQLEEAHWSAGFRPRPVSDLYNDLIHPVEMMMRGLYCWHQTGWPDRGGRLHYAHTLFNLYILRSLEFLSMRLWPLLDDEAPGSVRVRLAEIQAVLDELWSGSPASQPAIVRDARWLIPLAQGPITDELAPYFEIARKVTATLPDADVLEIQRAHVRLLGGHLTSQIRYYCTQDGVPIHDQSVVLRTRTSNALDFALLVQGLVPLLKAYESASQRGDQRTRLAMAGAISQGVSSDPELFLNRTDLLGAYSMMEDVFLVRREDQVIYSPDGQRHLQLLTEYRALIDRLIQPLRDDVPRFRPIAGGCSPYGVIFGLPSNLLENMALKAIDPNAETRFSLEDIFDDCLVDPETGSAKLAWVNGWRNLPHIAPEVQRMFDYPQQFAEDIFNRIERELGRRDSQADGSQTGRLYIVSGHPNDATSEAIPKLRAQYFASSDRQILMAQLAEPYDPAKLLADRQEGHFLVTYETAGGWTAIKKDLLTKVLGAGRDAKIVGLPQAAARTLQLMCPDLVASGS